MPRILLIPRGNRTWMLAYSPWMRRSSTASDHIVARLSWRHAPAGRDPWGLSLQLTAKEFRPPLGHRHASAGRDRGPNTERADPAAERLAGAAVDRLRQPDESPAFAQRRARQGSRRARRSWSGPGQAGVPIPHRKPRARRSGYACRSRPSQYRLCDFSSDLYRAMGATRLTLDWRCSYSPPPLQSQLR